MQNYEKIFNDGTEDGSFDLFVAQIISRIRTDIWLLGLVVFVYQPCVSLFEVLVVATWEIAYFCNGDMMSQFMDGYFSHH